MAGWKRLGLARGLVRVGSEARASAQSLGPRRIWRSPALNAVVRQMVISIPNVRTWLCHPTHPVRLLYIPLGLAAAPFVVASALSQIFVFPSYSSSNSLHLHLAGASTLCWLHTKTRKPSESPSAPASRWFSGHPRPCLVPHSRTVSVLLEGGKSGSEGQRLELRIKSTAHLLLMGGAADILARVCWPHAGQLPWSALEPIRTCHFYLASPSAYAYISPLLTALSPQVSPLSRPLPHHRPLPATPSPWPPYPVHPLPVIPLLSRGRQGCPRAPRVRVRPMWWSVQALSVSCLFEADTRPFQLF